MGIVVFLRNPRLGEATVVVVAVYITVLRLLRTITFCATRIPPPSVECLYRKMFVDTPGTGAGIWANLMWSVKWSPGGGCNDLIFSGHATLFAAVIVGCLCIASPRMSVLLGALGVPTLLRSIATQHHYTVDMLVAVYVSVLLYFALIGWRYRTLDP